MTLKALLSQGKKKKKKEKERDVFCQKLRIKINDIP